MVRRFFTDDYGITPRGAVVIAVTLVGVVLGATAIFAMWFSATSCTRAEHMDAIEREWDVFAGCLVTDPTENRVVIK